MLGAQIKFAELPADLQLVKTFVPLNAMLESHLTALLQHAAVETVFAGQAFITEGGSENQFIYLLHGDVELHFKHTQGNEGDQVVLKSGISCLCPIVSKLYRPKKAFARTDCSILRLDAEELDKLLSWSQIAEYLLVDISYQRDLDEDMDWMITVLKSNLFFKVPPINVQKIFSRLTSVVVDAGDVILRQGELGDGCYFIKEGEAEVTQSPDAASSSKPIAKIGVGRCFGEDALVNQTVRNATVTMLTSGVLMRLEKRDFILLLKTPHVDMLSNSELIDELESGTVCIDVRTESEYTLGHITKSVNIPLNLLRIKLRLLDKNTKYVVCCDTGRRSGAAVCLLNQQGFRTTALSSGLNNIPFDVWQTIKDTEQNFFLRNGQVVQGQ